MTTTAALVERGRQGDTQALAALFGQHARRLLGFAHYRMGPELRGQYEPEDIVQECLLRAFDRFGLFMQDYGGPVGFRILTRHPEWAEWLILQNTNAYEVGFTPAWDGLRNALWKNRTPEAEQALLPFLSLDGIQLVYRHGHRDLTRISPDNWNMDFRFMERPNARQVQLDLFYDYRTNVPLYPEWQRFLRERKPRTLIFWGQEDLFFTPAGGEAYLADLPSAELHRLEAGHFAVEEHLEYIAGNMRRFYDNR